MRIREEDCNLVLLAVVTLFTLGIAGGATLLQPVSAADRTTPSTSRPSTDLTGRTPVRVVGAPFVPNTHPRER